MKILYIIPSVQHPRVPGSHRHFHFIKELAARHQVALFALSKSEVAEEILDELRRRVDRLSVFYTERDGSLPRWLRWAGAVPGVGPAIHKELKHRAALRSMKRAVRRLAAAESFHVVVFHGKSVYPVIAGWRGAPIVADFCDATSMRISSLIRGKNIFINALRLLRLAQVRQVEKALLRKSARVAFISARDQQSILGYADGGNILPNGVDLKYWTRSADPAGSCSLVFTGVMSYEPNQAAALALIEEILPRVRAAVPNVRLLVVGSNPSAALVRRASQDAGVTVTGYVDDVRPYLQEATVFVAPIRFASGTQNKVLEAMAMTLPVVTSRIVAEGLTPCAGTVPPVVVADDYQVFADRVIELLHDQNARRQLASRGRAFVEDHFSWKSSADRLEAMCIEAAGTSDRATKRVLETLN